MDKGKQILVSLSLGLIFMSFIDFKMPIFISLGMTVFVTILAFHDFINTGESSIDFFHDGENKWVNNSINFLYRNVNIFISIIKVLTEIALFFSIPLSIFISYVAINHFSIEDMNNLQQRMTLYTLGLVIFTITYSKRF